ncbi:hypothetical protein BDZ89DRAFT_1072047, partial [Hymenopellis radicata]
MEMILAIDYDDDYEKRFPPDPIYEEVSSPNARVYRVYMEESAKYDAYMTDEAREGLDVLLVFVSWSLLCSPHTFPDRATESTLLLREIAALQRAQMNGTSVDSIPSTPADFVPSSIDVWVNGLWFTSLTLSLASALFAVLIKQWIRHYTSLIRQYRFMGLQKWHVPTLIGILPVLMHLSLAIFFVGLTLFLAPLRPSIAGIVGTTAVWPFTIIYDITFPLYRYMFRMLYKYMFCMRKYMLRKQSRNMELPSRARLLWHMLSSGYSACHRIRVYIVSSCRLNSLAGTIIPPFGYCLITRMYAQPSNPFQRQLCNGNRRGSLQRHRSRSEGLRRSPCSSLLMPQHSALPDSSDCLQAVCFSEAGFRHRYALCADVNFVWSLLLPFRQAQGECTGFSKVQRLLSLVNATVSAELYETALKFLWNLQGTYLELQVGSVTLKDQEAICVAADAILQERTTFPSHLRPHHNMFKVLNRFKGIGSGVQQNVSQENNTAPVASLITFVIRGASSHGRLRWLEYLSCPKTAPIARKVIDEHISKQ